MASNINPERFKDGNVISWLNLLERYATANSWDAATRLTKLPAFLQGPAVSYYESLHAEQRGTYDALINSLKCCFSASVDRERYHREFEQTVLHPSEDPFSVSLSFEYMNVSRLYLAV